MKLQPNFSWQKYEGKPEDQKEQFQYQLQQQHIQVANSVNATIDDESFFTRERMTAFTWMDNKPIWKKTFQITLSIVGANIITHNISSIETVIALYGTAQDAIPLATSSLSLPYVNLAATANQIEIFATPTTIQITLGNATWQNYIAFITIEYTKS